MTATLDFVSRCLLYGVIVERNERRGWGEVPTLEWKMNCLYLRVNLGQSQSRRAQSRVVCVLVECR